MELFKPETGTKLELELLDNAGDRIEPILISEFESFENNNEAIIAAPIREGNIYPIHVGTHMNVYYLKSKGKDISLFKFRAVVRGREKHDNLHFLRIALTDEIVKVQRRRYFRFECSLTVEYRVVESENDKNNSSPFLNTLTYNLSGGGIGLLLEDRIEEGSFVECRINIGKEITFIGRVVRCVTNEIETKFKYKAGIAFVKIENNDREAIVRYIFKQQRKLLKKGLI